MNTPIYTYDQASDTLSIVFIPGEKATGIELTDHILLHINKTARQVNRITLLDYSVLIEQTVYGPRIFPLTGLADLTEPVRDLVLDLLREAPSNAFLQLMASTAIDGQIVPVLLVQPIAPELFGDDDMLPEYDFSQGVRGKHADLMRQGYSVVIHTCDGETVRYDVPPLSHHG